MKKASWLVAIILLVVLTAGCGKTEDTKAPTDPTQNSIQLAQPDMIRTVYEPETSLVAPPSVVLKVETMAQYHLLSTEKPPQAAWFTVDETGEAIIVEGDKIQLADVFAACYGKIIPVFELQTIFVAQTLQSFSRKSRTTDFLVISEDPEILNEITLAGVHKGLITQEKGTECARQAHMAGADIVLLSGATRTEVEYLQMRFLSVMLCPGTDTETAVYAAVDCGANHVVVPDCEKAYNTYESVTGEPRFVRRPFVVAHAGVSSVAPENSVDGFLEAVEAGADAVECDVFLTSDGYIVIHHDETLVGSTVERAEIAIESLTRDELKQYTLNPVGAYSNSRIAFLDEFFGLMKDNDIHLIIEVKTENPQCIDKIRSLAEEYQMLDRINIISFHLEQVIRSHEVMPEVGASLTVNAGSNTADNLIRSAYSRTEGVNGAYSPNANFTGEAVRAMQHRGILVNLWTVDDIEPMLSASRKGISFLTTNTAMYRFVIDIETSEMASESIFSIDLMTGAEK